MRHQNGLHRTRLGMGTPCVIGEIALAQEIRHRPTAMGARICVVWVYWNKPGWQISSCTAAGRWRHGEACKSFLRVVRLEAQTLDRICSMCPEVGVGVTGHGTGRHWQGLSSTFWVVEGCTCRAFSGVH